MDNNKIKSSKLYKLYHFTIRSKFRACENARATLHQNEENFNLKKNDLCTRGKCFKVMTFFIVVVLIFTLKMLLCLLFW